MMEQHSKHKGKRKRRTQVGCSPSAAQGNSNVSKTAAPPSKKGKEAANAPSGSGQREATKPVMLAGKFMVNDLKGADSFASQYAIGEKLGEGGYGTVFEGTRLSDGLQVAIKFVKKEEEMEYLESLFESEAVPVEVALMQMMSLPPICDIIIKLIEWFDEPDQFILVLERPEHSIDLKSFLNLHGGRVSEETARVIMLQVVQAAKHCHKRGVLHRDIKLQNLLINPDTFEVKLIDFGCGERIKTSDYDDFKGTYLYCPPEFFLKGKYQAKPLTVWSLGVLLFRIVCGYLPFSGPVQIVGGVTYYTVGLSNECRNLIQLCLRRQPHRRPNFRRILKHKWFKPSNRGSD